MGLSIANNVTSLNAQNNLNKASMNVRSSVEKLSSGLKINRGADGPAALVISEKQRAQIAGLKQAIENTDKAAIMFARPLGPNEGHRVRVVRQP